MQVQISQDVQLNELRAENAWLRNRNLIQAQAIEDLKAELAFQLAAATDQVAAAAELAGSASPDALIEGKAA